jgi:hypothetical protein
MPRIEQEISEIRKYFVTWITEINLATALDYFDINKISEGTAQRILNIIFGYQLQDLNRIKKNFPGIDLGDPKHGIAFQITSRKDATKITDSLKIFVSNNYCKDFSSGLFLFIVNTGKRPSIKSKILDEYKSIFNIKTNILFPEDLIKFIEDLYYKDFKRFNALKQFLKQEFGTLNQHSSTLYFTDQQKKLEYFRQLFIANYEMLTNRFVPFLCKVGEKDISTEELPQILLLNKGNLLIGPSGCGKSILARKIAVDFLNNGLPVLLEAKYYETDLNALFEKEIKAYGFINGNDFFTTAEENQLKTLLIIDGLNECNSLTQPRLLLDLEYIVKKHNVLVLITTQEAYEGLNKLNLAHIFISYPDLVFKKAIALKYDGNKNSKKLTPLLQVISTSLEAKMIGEIAFVSLEKVSRFTILEIFIKNKLADFKTDGFILLSNIARVISDKISFNLPERFVEELLRSCQLTVNSYKKCLSVGLLEYKDGKVSFAHEMFFNFFVADSIVRYAADAGEINAKINAPKNFDKKLLIIGSIDNTDILDYVLSNLTDSELLANLYVGDGGEYCKLWIARKLGNLLVRIKAEIQQVKFEFSEESLSLIRFKPDCLWNWTAQELSLINLLPKILIKNQYLNEVFELVGFMDEQCIIAAEELFYTAKEKKVNVSVRSAIFFTSYNSIGMKEFAITRIVSELSSGFLNKNEINDDSIQNLLKTNSLTHGQIYFLLLLLRCDDKLQLLYPYIHNLLTNWHKLPYHLILEILNQIGHCYKTEEQQKDLIRVLENIHSETQNPLLSSSLFETLLCLGALSNDVADYESTVEAKLIEILANPHDSNFWNNAAMIYYSQFDHPYSEAFYAAIDKLSNQDKNTFLHMAIQSHNINSFFIISLIRESWKYLGSGIAPYLTRWTEVPIADPIFPQNSLSLFFLAHLLLAQSGCSIVSRCTTEIDEKKRSLFAVAEVYYWLNKINGDSNHNKQRAKVAATILFEPDNPYVIDSIWVSVRSTTSLITSNC